MATWAKNEESWSSLSTCSDDSADVSKGGEPKKPGQILFCAKTQKLNVFQFAIPSWAGTTLLQKVQRLLARQEPNMLQRRHYRRGTASNFECNCVTRFCSERRVSELDATNDQNVSWILTWQNIFFSERSMVISYQRFQFFKNLNNYKGFLWVLFNRFFFVNRASILCCFVYIIFTCLEMA